MKPTHISIAMPLVCLSLAPVVLAQQRATREADPEVPDRAAQAPVERLPQLVVPRLVRFSGIAKDSLDKPRTGIVGLTFAIYKDQEGGAVLWLETQNAELNEEGRYTVLLGATKSEGVPLELFTSGEPRWLGVRVQLPGEVEQPRVLLVSVPYALKAADAETLGGKSLSSFVLNETPATGTSGISAATTQATAGTTPQPRTGSSPTSLTVGGTGTANFVAKFIDSTNVGNSRIFDNGTNIGIGTAAPAVAVDVVGNNVGLRLSGTGTHQVTVTGASSGRLGEDATGFFFSSDTNGKVIKFLTDNGALNEWMRITSAGNVGIGTTTPAGKLDVNGTGNFIGNTTAFSSAIVSAKQSGSSPPPFVPSPTTVPPVAVAGIASATSGVTAGVGGIAFSPNSAGVGGLNFSSVAGTGVYGFSAATSGNGFGIQGEVASANGVAGAFLNDGGGNILDGATISSTTGKPVSQFRVDGSGRGFFNGGTQTGGADFAESVAVRGEHSQYEPGDVLVIDLAAGRRLMLSQRAYSTRVAGIYSTKPGVLATTHSIDESDALAEEIPLAIVGIVPCKVTAENGAIAPGDLLVTSSSTLGYAMKGTNRTRMLGAVVGKALEPLREGKGVIQVLVTLQ